MAKRPSLLLRNGATSFQREYLIRMGLLRPALAGNSAGAPAKVDAGRHGPHVNQRLGGGKAPAGGGPN